MKIELKKFGTTLISRQNGSEAFKAFQSTLRDLKSDENLEKIKVNFKELFENNFNKSNENLEKLF